MTAELIGLLVGKYPEIEEIWLIGSRVNGSERPNSDWDYLIFGTERVINSLRQQPRLNASNIDLLIVYDGNRFKKPWRDGSQIKSGSLSGWGWEVTGDGTAIYRAAKWRSGEDFDQNNRIAPAKRIWKKP